MELEGKDLNQLITYVRDGEIRINDAKRVICSSTNDFDIWKEFSTDRVDFRFLLGIDTPIRKFIDKHMSWIYEEYRGIKLDVDFFLEAIKELKDSCTKEEIIELKEYMVKVNFGSMIIDW